MSPVSYPIRTFCRNPGFTIVAVLTIGICIGANLTIFALLDATVLRPLPFPEPNRLVVVNNAYPGIGVERGNASIANYFDRRDAIDAFESLSLHIEMAYTVGEAGSSRRVETARVTPEFFRTLGVLPAMGREFTEEELSFEDGQVVIITDEFWRSEFNSDPDVLGREFLMHSLPTRVVGVLPPGFRFLSSNAEIYRPFCHYTNRRKGANRHANDGQMVARLAPNCSIVDAQTQLVVFNETQLKDDPLASTIRNTGFRTVVAPLHDDHVRSVKPILVLLQCGVLCLLLIGVVNLAGLLLIRASGRTKETAVRKALGAGWSHLALLVLAETIALSLAGGVVGVLFALLGIRLAELLGTDALPLGTEVTFDGRVAGVAVLASLCIAVCIALPIIWLNARDTTSVCLNSESRGGTVSRNVQRLRHGFIVAQIAIAFVLLCGAGLLSVSLSRVLDKSPGFDSDNLLTAEIVLPTENYPTNAAKALFADRLLKHLGALPGVTDAAISSSLPFSTNDTVTKAIFPEGSPVASGEGLRAHYFTSVSPNFWQAMSIPLLEGRRFDSADNADPPRIAIIDQTVADRYWPAGDAIGSRFSASPYGFFDRGVFIAVQSTFMEKYAYTVVGIVGNVTQHDLAETDALGTIYFPYTRWHKFHFVLRTSIPANAMPATVRKVVRDLDSMLPIDDFKTMQTRIDDSLVARRSPALLAGIFAGVALLLAGLGTYGVISHAAAQRRREVGIRMALGATRPEIYRQFLNLGLRLLAAGTAIGCIGAWAAGRIMQSVLYEVPSFDPRTLVMSACLMSLVTLPACLMSAIRAAHVAPMDALRSE